MCRDSCPPAAAVPSDANPGTAGRDFVEGWRLMVSRLEDREMTMGSPGAIT